jgi:O-antigen ligase
VWIGSDPVMSRFETLGQEYNLNGQNRISIWRDTLGLIRHHPLLGTGLGSFAVVYPSVQTAFLALLVEHAHCDYLEVASELGLPGGILVFGSIFWILARTARQYRQAEERFDRAISLGCIGSIAAILVHSLADFNLYIPANALVFTIILAMAWSGVRPVHAHYQGSWLWNRNRQSQCLQLRRWHPGDPYRLADCGLELLKLERESDRLRQSRHADHQRQFDGDGHV